ncbi:hypothetical protein EDB85DRAFT_228798 [Lactarius pseudohatsudake]|nr:hypothetical protein EDB85DRAFT_228798 [Lactarius pseudohatsudake]
MSMYHEQDLPMPHRPPSAPPPYTYPPTSSNGPGTLTESHRPSSPLHFATVVHPRVPGPSKSPRRPLPPLPEFRVDPPNRSVANLSLASVSRPSLRVSTSSSSSLFKPSASSAPLPSSPPLVTPVSPPVPSSSSSTRPPRHRSLFSLLRPSRHRFPTKQIAEREAQASATDARLQAEEAKRTAELEAVKRAATEEHARLAATQSDAKEAIRSNVRSLLLRHLPSDEDYDPIFKKCAEICESGGLNLSDVLQEPLIDGKPPVYWAILNGPSTSLQGSDAAFDTLVVALLGACQPLKETTITSVRLACMLTSNNVLLQHLFRRFPALSPLTPGDAILLSSAGGGDVADVDEKQDGSGTFVARIQVRRFRLRMRVSKLIRIEFVTSDRIWTITFSVRPENVAEGRSESRWLLSLGLADHSMPAWVDADLVVSGSPPPTNEADDREPTFTIPLCCNVCELKPGSESAIRIRLDDGPLRPHLFNESQALVDSDGTLHAQFTARLTRPPRTFLSPSSIDFSDTASQTSSALDAMTTTTSSRSEPPRSPISTRSTISSIRKKRQARDGPQPVYATLRRSGR